MDGQYTSPLVKATVVDSTWPVIDAATTYQLLKTIGRTAAGPDGLPSWFLVLAAPMIAEPVAYLYNTSIHFSYVPPQWKTSIITPVPKIKHPTEDADYRPISVTPILCRLLEKYIVRRYFNPILLEPQLNRDFTDQFAFRPTGSTTAALIALTSTKCIRQLTYYKIIAYL